MRARPFALWLLCLLLLCAACTSDNATDEPQTEAPEGPAEVRLDVVEEHAQQFDEDLPEREAGTQEEFAAATYITGHLQQAGYKVSLESVPFKDLVRSTNVVALPPGGEIEAVVTVLYDTVPSATGHGSDIGLFLEIARAFNVLEPGHNVQFVALGAELTAQGGGNLGSRVLAAELRDLEPKPLVIGLLEVPGGGFKALGPTGDDLNAVALEQDVPVARPLTEPLLPAYLRATDLMADQGLTHAIAAGGIEEIGEVVLAYLAAR